jgi:hypothetical protein
MDFFRVKITKNELDKLSKEEQILLFQLTHFLNEISILQKCVVISGNGINTLNKIEKHGQISLALFFIRLLAGKLKEGWEMLQRDFFGSKLSKYYENGLPSAGKDSLNHLKKYFSGDNVINFVRNEFSFHYGKEKIKKELNKVRENEIFEMLLCEEGQGNCLYTFSDFMVHKAIFSYFKQSDIEKALNKLMDEIIRDVSRWFLDFGGECLLVIVKKLNIDSLKEEIPDPPLLRELRLPFFVKK